MSMPAYIIEARALGKSFKQESEVVRALSGVSFGVKAGSITALVGPDGAGKTTLLRILAGLLRADAGELLLEGRPWPGEEKYTGGQGNLRDVLGYMPQKFGLYEDLTVQENLDLYADLRGLGQDERAERYRELLAMAGLERFRPRLAGKLSGGMKQKLGLICTLVQPPKLLLLDEPTVGVDPLSRRELWQIIDKLQKQMGMAVVVSTAYLDEAALCDSIVLLFEGQCLAHGSPDSIRQGADGLGYSVEPEEGESPRQLQARLLGAGGIVDAVPQNGRVRVVAEDVAQLRESLPAVVPVPSSLEDSFMLLLHRRMQAGTEIEAQSSVLAPISPFARAPSRAMGLEASGTEPIIEAHNVSRQFGDFVAVNNVSFTVNRGEIFGLLGPNGAGKTTTFKMLCGLLPVSRGQLRVAGVDVGRARKEARRHIGYVAQKFSLYAALTVRENLRFFACAYGLRGRGMHTRIEGVAEEFGLEGYLALPAGSLPGGYRQRLAMAVALLHKPDMLFLDEPTSGADPQARRAFWQRISRLADLGVTVVVTTHFMEEAEYCDRILIQDSGIMLALGTPAAIREQAAHAAPDDGAGVTSMDDAFVCIVRQARAASEEQAEVKA